MNYKLEKFWNDDRKYLDYVGLEWTINLKSFEITIMIVGDNGTGKWTINLKSFEMMTENI